MLAGMNFVEMQLVHKDPKGTDKFAPAADFGVDGTLGFAKSHSDQFLAGPKSAVHIKRIILLLRHINDGKIQFSIKNCVLSRIYLSPEIKSLDRWQKWQQRIEIRRNVIRAKIWRIEKSGLGLAPAANHVTV